MAKQKTNNKSLIEAIKTGNIRLVKETIKSILSKKVSKRLNERQKLLSKKLFKESKIFLNEQKEVLDTLRDIIKSHSRKAVKFSTGETTLVDALTASAIITVYDALKKQDAKDKFKKMANTNPVEFMKIANFSFKHTKLA